MDKEVVMEKVRFEDAVIVALKILTEQDYVPMSPGVVVADGVRYCAAAAVVRAGEIISGRDQGLLAAMEGSDSEAVISCFVDMGWDEGLGRKIMSMNDRQHPVARKDMVVMYLTKLCAFDRSRDKGPQLIVSDSSR
jgi:hypothetical protein